MLITAPSSIDGPLNAISANSASDVWAVGTNYHTTSTIIHWNGSTWQAVAHVTKPYDSLYGISANGTHDVVVVGQSTSVPSVERWNGTQWKLETLNADALNISSGWGLLKAVSDNLAVGYSGYTNFYAIKASCS